MGYSFALTEEQYFIYLCSLPYYRYIGEAAESTEVYYIFDLPKTAYYLYYLPKKSIFVFYLGYFIIATTLIISIKYNHEKPRYES